VPEPNPSPSAEQLAKLDRAEQIRELIFQLRDQHGEQMSWPGSCDVFKTLDEREDTPAHELVKMGYAAVPQLIGALDDRRISRSVTCHRMHFYSHEVLRVRDCAEQILSRITDCLLRITGED
jgi:hypothetical protein